MPDTIYKRLSVGKSHGLTLTLTGRVGELFYWLEVN